MALWLITRGAFRANSLASRSFLSSRPTVGERPRSCQPGEDIRVRVKGAYDPETILARSGRPLRITFHRDETAACSERVVFPAFGKSAMLPPHEDVTVELPPLEPGEYEFTCQMGMLRGLLIVRPDDAEA